MAEIPIELQQALAQGISEGAMGVIGIIVMIFLVVALVSYIYFAIVLMAIAKKTNTPNGWLAWIPIANLFLMSNIAKTPWWTILIALFGGMIPFVGGILPVAVAVWWWWKIAEAVKKPGFFGILMMIPVVNFIIGGILAWGK